MHPHGPTPDDVAIRVVDPQDVGELLTLQRAAYVTEAQIYGDPGLPALTQSLAELQRELASTAALKAVTGHRMIGAVRADVQADVIHIGRLVVAPDWQGHGIGSRLLAAVEDLHPEAATAAVFTGHLSVSNLALYSRCGFREERREQLRPGIELVHMRKPLAAAPTRSA